MESNAKVFLTGLFIGAFIIGIIWLINPMQQVQNQRDKILIDSLKSQNKELSTQIDIATTQLDVIQEMKRINEMQHNKRLKNISKLDADSLYLLINNKF